jgi:O-antigen ligase
LMGVGVVLAIALLATKERKGHKENSTGLFRFMLCSLRPFAAIDCLILFIATGTMGVGLVMSYSRGAWAAMVIALLYLAWCYGKLKWQFVLPVVLVAATVVAVFWHSTADTAPWYVKRLDLSRPSAQHRVSAWRGAVHIMRDHPLGVGWNQAVSVYEKDYSPPEGGAGALTMNSYLMLGTELGLPGLICFVAYLGLCLRGKVRMQDEEGRIKTACRAGALVFVVAFWFDGGLFDLPTASVFWILLELGSTAWDGGERVSEKVCQ